MIGELEWPHWKLGSKNHPLSRMPRSARHSSLPFMSHATSNPIDPNAATMRRPSVAGVEFAWVALVCRLTFGVPENAVRSHTIFPVALSSA